LVYVLEFWTRDSPCALKKYSFSSQPTVFVSSIITEVEKNFLFGLETLRALRLYFLEQPQFKRGIEMQVDMGNTLVLGPPLLVPLGFVRDVLDVLDAGVRERR
jgi:hypothetical protein